MQCLFSVRYFQEHEQRSSELSGTINPVTEHHITEDPNLQQSHCWNNSQDTICIFVYFVCMHIGGNQNSTNIVQWTKSFALQ